MFEDTMRAIDEINGSTFGMSLSVDEEGYIDKECPNPDCLAKFKVFGDDWETIGEDDGVYCPFCGTVESKEKWYTTEQIELLEQRAQEYISSVIGQALETDARRFNRAQPKRSFFKMSMKVTGITSAFENYPAPALQELVQKIECEECGTHYAIIGSAFYCPKCGNNSAKLTFSNTIEKVKAKIKNIPIIMEAIMDKDEAARIASSLIESSIPDLVVAFQRACECVYHRLPNAKRLRRNAFQNLDEGSGALCDCIGYGYDKWLTAEEYATLRKCFQQRHLLQHNDGIVDQDYLRKSGDTKYAIGQRLVVHKSYILEYAGIVEKLGNAILSLEIK